MIGSFIHFPSSAFKRQQRQATTNARTRLDGSVDDHGGRSGVQLPGALMKSKSSAGRSLGDKAVDCCRAQEERHQGPQQSFTVHCVLSLFRRMRYEA